MNLRTLAPLPADLRLVPDATVRRFAGILQSVRSEGRIDSFLRQAIPLAEGRGLGFEAERMRAALASGDPGVIREALGLFQRPGRIFYALAPDAESMAATLGMGPPGVEPEAPGPSDETSREDLSAQIAWHQLGRWIQEGAKGAARGFNFWPLLADPAGAYTSGFLLLMDRQGVLAHYKEALREGGNEILPTPPFAALAHEVSDRLARYNQGLTDGVGNISFGFPPELQPVFVPRGYLPFLRGAVRLQFVVPAASALEEYCDERWRSQLVSGAVLATSVKGLTTGARFGTEHLWDSIYVAGIHPSRRMMDEGRAILQGSAPTSESWNATLLGEDTVRAIALAKRWAGPDAKSRVEFFKDPGNPDADEIPIFVVESRSMVPPRRVTVVSDPYVIFAGVIASTDKNLKSIFRAARNFHRMLPFALEGRSPDDQTVTSSLRHDHEAGMAESEVEIRAVMAMDGIPPEKRILMPDVGDDIRGSLDTKHLKEIYTVVRDIFRPDASELERHEAMVLLKMRIGDYYATRNSCYGFCLAVDREIALRPGFVIHSQENLDRAVQALKDDGTWDEKNWRVPRFPEGPHSYFSTIPDGLRPEGLQVAEQFYARYGKNVKGLPPGFKEAHLLVQRLQRDSALISTEVILKIVDLSREIGGIYPYARVVAGSADLRGAEANLQTAFLRCIEGFFEGVQTAARLREVSRRALSPFAGGQTTGLADFLEAAVRSSKERIEHHQQVIGREHSMEEIYPLTQAILEILTSVQRFVLPLSGAGLSEEVASLRRKMDAINTFIGSRIFEDLFPNLNGDSPLVSGDLAADLVAIRGDLGPILGEGMIEIVHQMSRHLHDPEKAIEKANILGGISAIQTVLHTAVPKVSSMQRVLDFLLRAFGVLSEISAFVQAKRMGADKCLLTYKALAEALLQARRYLVFPGLKAAHEFGHTLRRFELIRDYLLGKADSPLALNSALLRG